MRIVLNHKSNLNYAQAMDYANKIQKIKTNHQLIVCPSSCYLPLFSNITLGSQDVSCYEMGSYTGEISAKALATLGVKYVLINHSERTKYFHEDLTIAKQKLQLAQAAGLIPIICIGDSKEEHEQGIYLQKIKERLEQLISADIKNYMIAYEPLFAIGTGDIPEISEIEQVISMLKNTYSVSILYGGSVNEKNVATLKKIKQLDGFLLGGISLNISSLRLLLQQL